MQVYILGARTSIAVSLLNSVSTFWPERKLWVSRLLNSGVRPRLVTEQGKLAAQSGKEVARMSDVVSRVLVLIRLSFTIIVRVGKNGWEL